MVRQGLSPNALERLRGFGFRSDYGRSFSGSNPRYGITAVVSVAALFDDREGSAKALAFLKARFLAQHPGAKALPASSLGAHAWGLGGRIFSNAPSSFRSFYYAWRVRNTALTLALSGYAPTASATAARALAEKVGVRVARSA